MPRPEKVQAVADIRERIEKASAVFLAEYSGLSVNQQQVLRRALKKQEAEFKVIKMTLARLAAAELGIDDIDHLLLGPTGVAYADGDPVSTAKVLKDFASKHDVFRIKGGLLSGEVLTPERVSELADVESREILLARLAGLFAAPISQVAGLFGHVQQEVVGLLQALLDQKRERVDPELDVPATGSAVDDRPANAEVDNDLVEGVTPEANDANGALDEPGHEPADAKE